MNELNILKPEFDINPVKTNKKLNKNVYELAFDDLGKACDNLAKKAYDHPVKTVEKASQEVLSSAAFGLLLGSLIPARGPLSLIIAGGLTLPILKDGVERLVKANTQAKEKNANVNNVAQSLANDTVKGAANFMLTFAGGAMGAEGGIKLAKTDTIFGDASQASQRFLINSENKVLEMAKKSPDLFKSGFTLASESDLGSIAAASKIGDLSLRTSFKSNVDTANSLQMFYGDLHLHSRYSDGIGLPSQIFDAEKNAGRDFAFVTDHNHILARGGVEPGSIRAVDEEGTPIEAADPQEYADTFNQAQAATQNGKFVGGVGSEVGTIGKPDPQVGHIAGGNHMNVFDSPDFLKTFELPRGGRMSFLSRTLIRLGLRANDDTQTVITFNDNDYKGLIGQMQKLGIKDSTGQDPIMQFNHPRYKLDYNPSMPADRQGHDFGAASFSSQKEWLQTMDPYVHNIEVMKGGALNPNVQAHVNPYYITSMDYAGYLDKGFHLSPTYGADTHYGFNSDGTPLRIGNPPAATGILAPSLDKESLLNGLRNRRTIATTDFKALSGVLTANDGNVLMGDILDGRAVNSLTPSVKVMGNVDPSAQYQVKIWSDPQIGDGKLASVIATQKLTGQQVLDSQNIVNFNAINHTLGAKSLIFAEIDRVSPDELSKANGIDPFNQVANIETQQWNPNTGHDFSQMAKDYIDGNDQNANLPYVDRLFTPPIWIEPLSGSSHAFLTKGLVGVGSSNIIGK